MFIFELMEQVYKMTTLTLTATVQCDYMSSCGKGKMRLDEILRQIYNVTI